MTMTALAAELSKAGVLDGAPRGVEKAALVVDAEKAYREAFGAPIGDLEKSVATPLRPLVQALMGAGPSGLNSDLQAIQKVFADLGKELTLTSPLSTSFAVYDLQAPAKKTFPVRSPFRNTLPRVPGEGTATHYKVIQGISNSGQGGVGNLRISISELPQQTVNGVTLNLPPEITYAAADATTSYVPMGLGSSASMIAQIAGRGFQDLRELAALSVLQSMMMGEDRMDWSGRTAALGAPTCAVTAQTPNTGFSALTGVTTNVYVKVTQVTMLGESAGSAAQSAAPSGAQDILVTITPVITNGNAEAFNIYASTGAADPGDGSRFFQGTTGYNKFELGGALKASGSTVPTSDTTNSSNDYVGVFGQLEGGSNFYSKALDTDLALSDIDNACVDRFDTLKVYLEEIWTTARIRQRIKDQVLNNGSNASGYRIELGQDGEVLGLVVSAVLNPASNGQMPLNIEPWFKPGSLALLSRTLPFPDSQIPNVWEMKLPQDYLAIDWPVIDMNYRNSVIAYGALIGYYPDANAWIRRIKNSYGTGTATQ